MTHRFWKVHGALIETGATFTLRGDFEQLGGNSICRRAANGRVGMPSRRASDAREYPERTAQSVLMTPTFLINNQT
jgi:hypothetical protein